LKKYQKPETPKKESSSDSDSDSVSHSDSSEVDSDDANHEEDSYRDIRAELANKKMDKKQLEIQRLAALRRQKEINLNKTKDARQRDKPGDRYGPTRNEDPHRPEGHKNVRPMPGNKRHYAPPPRRRD
jgi:hypothetical protein